MKNVLIVSGHPNLDQSIANKIILEEVAQALPEVKIRRLDTLYPTYQFDIAAEQAALKEADIVVWQFPFSWYSVPGLMKLWIDLVYVHGFAHGSKAQLNGQKLIISFTAGAPEEIYAREAFLMHPVSDYMAQFESTSRLCGLDLQEPIYTTGISFLQRDDEAMLQSHRQLAKQHAERLINKIKALAA